MKSCSACRQRARCVKLCAEIEARLPKELTGKDTRRELSMDAQDFKVAVEVWSYSRWAGEVRAMPMLSIDLSALTPKERNALLLLAEGMTMRGAARRLKINLNAFQSRVASARRKLSAGQSAIVTEGGAVRPPKKKGGAL